jgi:hypothetical protein
VANWAKPYQWVERQLGFVEPEEARLQELVLFLVVT